MARIRAIRRPTEIRVVVAGVLRAGDMRRLEHACGPALTSERADLIVDLERVTAIDGVAAAHLRYMEMRGAVIKKPE